MRADPGISVNTIVQDRTFTVASVSVTLQKNYTPETVKIPPLDRQMMWLDLRATCHIYLDLTFDIYTGEKTNKTISMKRKHFYVTCNAVAPKPFPLGGNI